MKKLDLVALLLSTTLLLGLSQAASAENLCSADTLSAKGTLDSSYDGFLSEKSANRDIDGLKDKLDAANTPKAKISLDAYDEISNELARVLGCIDTYYK